MSHYIKKQTRAELLATYAGETQFLSYRRSTLAQSSKYSQKTVDRLHCPPRLLSLDRKLTGYQSAFLDHKLFQSAMALLRFTVAQVIDALKLRSE